ncbi:hypothetical protein Q31b_09050 [Novipirellula aureliae]|uniref:Uncharacterized protein n=1 Tax=Novipirellula aureliae TaxID=2527966 RepID=A0A5C6EER4_9BACT|nr:hypothetical protein [Novipirellula aureliae]TWU45729.1 hypothetical protein Q31b_09050 [Novipirellula aureliae]
MSASNLEPKPERALIEIGVIVAGPLDFVDSRAIKLAVEQADDRLSELFPEFHFDFFENRRPELMGAGRVEPSLLLRQAVEERDAKHWDFAFVLTAAELIGNYSPYCFAALSRPLDAAVISMSLIDPQALGVEVNSTERIERIARRLSRLMLHSLGHLSGLPKSDHPNDLLYHPPNAAALDLMAGLDSENLERQRSALAEIADQRLEERFGKRKLGAVNFILRAVWINRREIYQAVFAARPWEFPKRLSRLTIASFSTLAILLLTAEAWDLALAQGTVRVMALVAVSLVATTAYVVARQQLLIRRGTRRTEQSVMTSASAIGTVFVGMLTTWLTLVVVGLCLAHLLFPSQLIATWAASSFEQPRELGSTTRPQMAFFCSSLALLIGSLGASFESQYYFRHIIFVDEEI